MTAVRNGLIRSREWESAGIIPVPEQRVAAV
jgi:hypothetical protein